MWDELVDLSYYITFSQTTIPFYDNPVCILEGPVYVNFSVVDISMGEISLVDISNF